VVVEVAALMEVVLVLAGAVAVVQAVDTLLSLSQALLLLIHTRLALEALAVLLAQIMGWLVVTLLLQAVVLL
jgi:hypothetical protein